MEKVQDRETAASIAFAAYTTLLGYPMERQVAPKVWTADQVVFIRKLTSNPDAANDEVHKLYTEAVELEPAWDNLDPAKRLEVARSGSPELARAFGHSIVGNEF